MNDTAHSPQPTANGFVYHTPELWESPTTGALNQALSKFHAEFEAVAKDGKSNRNKYATLDGILNVVRPLLAKHGLSIMQPISGTVVTTMLRHESGEFVAASMPYKPMSSNGTNDLQNAGGGFTYIKRYALSAMLSISTEADDDGASGGVTVGKAQPATNGQQQKTTSPAQQRPPVATTLDAAKNEVLSLAADAPYAAYAAVGMKFKPAPFFADLSAFISATLDARDVKRPERPSSSPQSQSDNA